MDSSMPGSPVIHCLPEFAQICVHWVSDAVQPPHPLLPPPFDFNLSQHQGLFQWVSSSHQVADVLELQLSISPSSEYSGLISFRIGWFDLLTAQGTLKSLLQHHHSKASILQHSAFYGPTLTSVYDYWKNHSFDYMELCQQVMSLLLNMLSRLGIDFLPSERSKCLLVSWLQSPSTVILKPKKRKSVTASTFSLSLPWSDGIRCYGLRFMNIEF